MFGEGETVTVTREGVPTGEFDDLGNPVIGTLTFDIEGVGVAPVTPQESVELFGVVNAGGYTLYFPVAADLQSTDLVEVRGLSGFQVEGGTVEWRSPFTGWNPGQVAIVRRAS